MKYKSFIIDAMRLSVIFFILSFAWDKYENIEINHSSLIIKSILFGVFMAFFDKLMKSVKEDELKES